MVTFVDTLEPIYIEFRWYDYVNQRVNYLGEWIHLEPQEANLLLILMVNRGRSLKAQEMIEMLWPDPDEEPDDSYSTLKQYIYRVRQKIPNVIISAGWGMGWYIPRPDIPYIGAMVHAYSKYYRPEPNHTPRKKGYKALTPEELEEYKKGAGSYNRKYCPKNNYKIPAK